MSTQTYVLGWAAFIVLAVAYCCSVQLSRPDEDWEGWHSGDWNKPDAIAAPALGCPTAASAKADSTCAHALPPPRLVEERIGRLQFATTCWASFKGYAGVLQW